MAMYQAKQDGRGCYRIFTTEIDADRRRRLDLEREIHAAVALNQFHLLLAPILDLNDRAVRGIRACLYWQHRSEEQTSELQSLMRISYAVFCLKKKNNHNKHINAQHSLILPKTQQITQN